MNQDGSGLRRGAPGRCTGPRVGDWVQLSAAVTELTSVGGVPGARLNVGERVVPVWVPLSQLTVTERRGRGER